MSTNPTPAAAPQQAGVVACMSSVQTAGAPPLPIAAAQLDRTPSKWEFWYKLTRSIALVFLIVLGLFVACSALSLRLWATNAPAGSTPEKPPAPPPAVTQEQLDKAVANALAPVKAEADAQSHALDRLVTLVGGYSLFITLTAYFSLKSAREEADKQIQLSATQLANHFTFTNDQLKIVKDNASEQLKMNREDWIKFKVELPDLGAMQETLQRLLYELERRVPIESDWNDEDSYNDLKEDQRQQILIAETTIAALPTLVSRKSSASTSLAGLYRSLARFYAARFKAGNIEADSARAEAYVNESLSLDDKHAASYRLRGAIYLARYRVSPGAKATTITFETRELLDRAAADLRRAIQDKNDLGAYYNLSYALALQSHVEDGVNLVREALTSLDCFPVWQKRKYLGSVMLNQACDLLTLAKASSKDPAAEAKLREECVDTLIQGLDLVSLLRHTPGLDHLKDSIHKEFAPAVIGPQGRSGGDLNDLTDVEKDKVRNHKPIGTLPAASQTAATAPTAIPPAAPPLPGAGPTP